MVLGWAGDSRWTAEVGQDTPQKASRVMGDNKGFGAGTPIGLEELIINMSGLHYDTYTKLGSPERETDQR